MVRPNYSTIRADFASLPRSTCEPIWPIAGRSLQPKTPVEGKPRCRREVAPRPPIALVMVRSRKCYWLPERGQRPERLPVALRRPRHLIQARWSFWHQCCAAGVLPPKREPGSPHPTEFLSGSLRIAPVRLPWDALSGDSCGSPSRFRRLFPGHSQEHMKWQHKSRPEPPHRISAVCLQRHILGETSDKPNSPESAFRQAARALRTSLEFLR